MSPSASDLIGNPASGIPVDVSYNYRGAFRSQGVGVHNAQPPNTGTACAGDNGNPSFKLLSHGSSHYGISEYDDPAGVVAVFHLLDGSVDLLEVEPVGD